MGRRAKRLGFPSFFFSIDFPCQQSASWQSVQHYFTDLLLPVLAGNLLMICAESFHGNPQFYSSISIGADKLIMLQLDYISLFCGNNTSYPHQFSWPVRQKS